ncbi:MAG TPA: alpha/beta hydrolase [Longimicrobium sp.]|jgi:pimeloyl-ACP methyl ester carboxylesterase|nr:alpha/beta hydrolase [Longimicrobium sp.]
MSAYKTLHRVFLPAAVLAAAACDANPAHVVPAYTAVDAEATMSEIALREVTLPSGVRLQYAETGKADGEPIILLHGYTDSWFSYSRVLPLLAPKYRAISLSQRGHGDSDRPGSYASADFAADVDAFMQALGIERATIVGHSMGSFIAQTVAIEYPQRVKKLVLVGSATVAGNEGVLGLRDAVQTLTDPVPYEFAYEFQASTAFVPLPQEFLETAVGESLKLPAQVWKDVLDGLIATENADRLDEITAPTLIMWGEQDGIFPRSEQDLLAARIPNATLSVYAETGHAPHWERPREFAKELEKFVKGD